MYGLHIYAVCPDNTNGHGIEAVTKYDPKSITGVYSSKTNHEFVHICRSRFKHVEITMYLKELRYMYDHKIVAKRFGYKLSMPVKKDQIRHIIKVMTEQ